MNFQIIIFTACGMFIDTIVLFFYLNCYHIKKHMERFVFTTYFIYFLLNFVMGYTDVSLWIRIISNVGMITVIGQLMYDGVNRYEIGKEAIVFLMLEGVAELLVIPVAFLFTNNFNADIFNDPTKPYLWLISMCLSRIIAMCLFGIYRKIQRRHQWLLSRQEILIFYLPLTVSFICFFIITEIVVTIDNFKKEKFSILLTAIACALIIYTLIHMIVYERYIYYRNQNQELLMLKQKEALKYEYYKSQMQNFENISILYHDLKNHMLLSNYDNAYFEKIKESFEGLEDAFDTGCEILNILLWEKHNEAVKCGIKFKCIIEELEWRFMDDIDICSIMGNILDNALEAGQEIPPVQEPMINIRIGYINNLIMIKMENTCVRGSRTIRNANIFQTTKKVKEIHGIGLKSVMRAVEKYDGHCEFDSYEDRFITEILIPSPIKQ